MIKVYKLEKIREGVGETNSSSSHALVFAEAEVDSYKENVLNELHKYLKENGVGLNPNYEYEFGWGNFEETSVGAFLNYAILGRDSKEEGIFLLKEEFEKYFNDSFEMNTDMIDDGYVDHQSYEVAQEAFNTLMHINEDDDRVAKMLGGELIISNDNGGTEQYEDILEPVEKVLENPFYEREIHGGYGSPIYNRKTIDNSLVYLSEDEEEFKKIQKWILLMVKEGLFYEGWGSNVTPVDSIEKEEQTKGNLVYQLFHGKSSTDGYYIDYRGRFALCNELAVQHYTDQEGKNNQMVSRSKELFLEIMKDEKYLSKFMDIFGENNCHPTRIYVLDPVKSKMQDELKEKIKALLN